MEKVLYLHVGAEMYGSDKVLLQLVTALDKSKFSPIVLLPEHGPLEQELIELGVDVHVMAYPIIRRKYFTAIGILKYVKEYIFASFKIMKFIRTHKIKIVHVNTIGVLEGVFIYAFSNIPVVWHVHEILTTPRFVYKLTSYLIGHYCTKAVAISKAVKKHLIASNYVDSDHVEVIYDGIDAKLEQTTNGTLRKELKLSDNTVLIGHVGRVNAWKGQEEFVKAGVGVLQKNPEAHLILCGNAFTGEEWRVKALEEMISDFSDVCSRIHYLGYRSDTDNIFESIDVFVSCSTRPEPFSMVTIEAMSHSVPVIAFDAGGPAEIVEDKVSGLLVPFNSVEELRDAISDLVENPAKMIEFGKKAELRVKKNFSLETFVQKFQTLYSDVLKCEVK
ncbi:glycosyltransferase family 4 protein [Lactiplantibacillus xiangfangensis]|uniref:glycosyltransferase family 4 protein n=1 Tax=Lactiplantibacillus xiangfangensis TaxID=942150 RepID=UPI000343AB6E|nr:glycosyltransferase [Lacticaseibacillus paracasei subsp. paracasei Lpp227]